MADFKIFLYLFTSNFSKFWRVFFLIVLFALGANFLTVLQPIIFATMMELVIPKNLPILNTEKTNESLNLEQNNFFDLNFIGEKSLEIIQNFYDFSQGSTISSLIFLSSLFLIIVILAAIFNYGATIITKWSNATLTISIRKKLLSHLLDSDYSFFTNKKYGEIISRIIQDSKSVAQGIIPVAQTIFHQGTLIIAYSFFLFNTDNVIFFASFVIFLIQYLIMLILKKPIKKSLIQVNNKSANLLSSLTEVFSGIRLSKAFNMKNVQSDTLDKIQTEERRFGFRAAIFDELQTPIGQILTSISTVIILFAILFQIQQNNITFQGGVMFVIIGRLIINPIIRLSTIFTWFVSLNASYYKINIYQKTKKKITDGKNKITSFKKEISVKNCKFSYNKETNLEFSNFSIQKNKTLAVVGHSGSGKSTLVDLVLRLYDPTKGKILIDGNNIKSFIDFFINS